MISCASRACTLLLLFLLLAVGSVRAQHTHAPSGFSGSASNFRFLPNLGQIADEKGHLRPDVLFSGTAPGGSIYLLRDRVAHVLVRREGDWDAWRAADGVVSDEMLRRFRAEHGREFIAPTTSVYRIDMELIDADTAAIALVPEDQKGDKSIFYLPHCPNGVNNVPAYGTVTYRNVWPHIDMVFRSTGDAVKCEFIVHPGGDPERIRFRYNGGEDATLASDGGLVVGCSVGQLTESAPVSWTQYEKEGSGLQSVERTGVESRFVVDEQGVVSVAVGDYDTDETLVIDPTRRWSTYYGGRGEETLNGGDVTEVDRFGNVLIAGGTDDYANFPANLGLIGNAGGFNDQGDVIVVKFDPDGNRLWSVVYAGSGYDLAHGIASDPRSAAAFIAGHTTSNDFPTTLGTEQPGYGGVRDAFILKLNPDGTRQWCTYYGGGLFDDGYGFAMDSSGNPANIITCASSGLATTGQMNNNPGAGSNGYDALVAKFNGANGKLVWSTYLGGRSTEFGYAAASDINDNIIVSGWTFSSDFPTHNPAQTNLNGNSDHFLTKYSSAGVMQWSTYWGGEGQEGDGQSGVAPYDGVALATDRGGNVMLVGATNSRNYPQQKGVQTAFGGGAHDAVVSKFSPSGQIIWSTYYGGSGDESGFGAASNNGGSVLVCGKTSGSSLPQLSTDAFSLRSKGGTEAYIMKLSPDGTRVEFATLYGGSRDDAAVGISFDPQGFVIVAGTTASGDFPTFNAYADINSGGTDAFLFKFCDADINIQRLFPSDTVCVGVQQELRMPTGLTSYRWFKLDGATSTLVSSDSVYRPPLNADGDFYVQVTGATGCFVGDTVHLRYRNVVAFTMQPVGDTAICEGDTIVVQLAPGNAATVLTNAVWYDSALVTPAADLNSSSPTGLTVRAAQSGKYRAILHDAFGCTDTTDVLNLTVYPRPGAISVFGSDTVCLGDSVTLTISRAEAAGETFVWSTGETGRSIRVGATGVYNAWVISPDSCVLASDKPGVVMVQVVPPFTVTSSLGRPIFCAYDSVMALQASLGFMSYVWRDERGDSIGSGNVLLIRDSGTYICEVFDGLCKGWDTTHVIRKNPIVPSLPGPMDTVQLCEGDSVLLRGDPGYAHYRWSSGDTTETVMIRTAGSYTVTLEDSDGCIGTSDTVTVIVHTRPVAGLRQTSRDTLTADPPGVLYTWTLDDVPTGDTSRSVGITRPGRWSVMVLDSNGCRDTAEAVDAGPAVASIWIDRYQGVPGDVVPVTIWMSGARYLAWNGITSFTARVHFNRTLLWPMPATAKALASASDTVLLLRAAIPSDTSDPIALAVIPMKVTLGNAASTPLVLDTFFFDQSPATLAATDGLFELSGLCTQGGTRLIDATGSSGIKRVSPNPAHERTELEYETVENGRIRLTLVDMNGRTISLLDGAVDPGRYLVELNTGTLVPGAYLILLETPTERFSTPLRVER